nr:MAG TPA: hypothetical protein [Caudoviricetes sp.]
MTAMPHTLPHSPPTTHNRKREQNNTRETRQRE